MVKFSPTNATVTATLNIHTVLTTETASFPAHFVTTPMTSENDFHVHENHRPHQCTECGKSFSQSSSLNKHLRIHSGERPYKCPHCVRAFTAASILRTHIRVHSGEKPFKCKHCGRNSASHAAHDSHVRRKHLP